jgi:hypothetical protein
MYTMHISRDGFFIPCVFGLLPNKQEATYRDFLHQLTLLVPDLQPKNIIVDFEQAAINAFKDTFSNANLHGCFYHLSQNIFRKVQSFGFQSRYSEDPSFAQAVRMLAALAFVPPDRVIDAFETLQGELPEIQQISDYFEDTYIGRPQRRGRRMPLYPISIWNVHSRISENIPRTSNAAEGYHRHLQSSIQSSHPNIWTFLSILKKEQALHEVKISHMLAGHPAPPQRKQYRQSQQRIMNLVAAFEEKDIMEYLRGISHNLTF